MSDASCPDCDSKFYRDGRCIICAFRREREQHRQMSERSGPEYDKAVSRGGTGTAAWRAAGSPVKVMALHESWTDAHGNRHGEQRWYLAAPFKRGKGVLIEATPEQVDAWYAWRNSRASA